MLTKAVSMGLRNGPGFVASALEAIILPPHRYEGMKVCNSTLMMRPTVRNLQFQKSNMATAAILKNIKIAISAAVSAISTKFGRVTQFGPRDRLVRYKTKIQDGGGRHP